MIGEECELLGISSPFSYVCKSKVLVYSCKIEDFYREMVSLNPAGLRSLKLASSKKIKEFTKLIRYKKEWDSTVGAIESHRLVTEKHDKMEANVRSLFSVADKPIIKNLVNILTKKEA